MTSEIRISVVNIAMVGKYTQLHDAYLSVVEALKHGGISCKAKVEITWIDSEELNEKNLDQTLHKVDGILVPGGFGNRGTEGMILAASVCTCTQDSISWVSASACRWQLWNLPVTCSGMKMPTVSNWIRQQSIR